jgi:UDP-N-acetylglucosamine--N-acetylmuramyl-(pentapeptide) pyrophosphoryl-undecaprenol N-acetylglucosamine transferase
MNEQPKIMIMAGGTGGHIFPGLAVAECIVKSGGTVCWLGAEYGLESSLVPAHGISLDKISITGLRGKGLAGWLLAPFRILSAIVAANGLLAKRRPDCVVSMGGYVAGPGGIAAWLRRIPLIVHEQNRRPGLTNRVLSRLARHIFEGFPGTFKAAKNTTTSGNPVRAEITRILPPAIRFSDRTGPVRILVLGGSQGAQSLNRIVPEAIAMVNAKNPVEIRHQAGKGNAAMTRARYQERGLNAEVCEFADDMAKLYAWAELVVCRAGALTVAEVAASGVAAVFIPFPAAVDDHQTHNASYLADAGGARILQEADLTADRLAQSLTALCGNREKLLRMAEASRSRAYPDAAEQVAAYCLGLAT